MRARRDQTSGQRATHRRGRLAGRGDGRLRSPQCSLANESTATSGRDLQNTSVRRDLGSFGGAFGDGKSATGRGAGRLFSPVTRLPTPSRRSPDSAADSDAPPAALPAQPPLLAGSLTKSQSLGPEPDLAAAPRYEWDPPLPVPLGSASPRCSRRLRNRSPRGGKRSAGLTVDASSVCAAARLRSRVPPVPPVPDSGVFCSSSSNTPSRGSSDRHDARDAVCVTCVCGQDVGVWVKMDTH